MKTNIPPCALDICLSNRCNMTCRYCYFHALNKGKEVSLSFEQAVRGVDIYLSHAHPSQIDKISLAGGEPFLDFPLLLKVVDHIRSRAGVEPDIEIFTNGTFLDSRRVGQLLKRRVKLIVSIDGNREINDWNRRFRRSPEKSVFDDVMANLKKLPKEFLRKMCVGVTFTSETAHSLAESIRFLRGLGFGEVQLNMNLLEVWPEKGIRALKRGARDLGGYFMSLARTEMKSFGDFKFGLDYFLLREESESLNNLSTFREISLAPDGRFYPCGLISTWGSQRSRYCVGNLKSGLDFEKMAGLRKEAVKFLKKLDSKCCITCYISNPMLLYFVIKLWKVDPLALFRSTRKVFDIIYEELGPYLSLERVFDTLSSDSLFGDFPHQPRRVADREVGRLMLELPGSITGSGDATRAWQQEEKATLPSASGEGLRLPDDSKNGRLPVPNESVDAELPCSCCKGTRSFPGLATAREDVDSFLYSPGERKELIFCGKDPFSRFELLEAISVYSIMKARHLGKKLSVSVAIRSGGVKKEHLEFLREHGILLEIPGGSCMAGIFDVLHPCDVRVVLNIIPADAVRLPEIFKDLVSSGFEDIRFEIASGLTWHRNNLKALSHGLEDVGAYICKRVRQSVPVFLENTFTAFSRRADAVKTQESPELQLLNKGCRDICREILRRSARDGIYKNYSRKAIARTKRCSQLFRLSE